MENKSDFSKRRGSVKVTRTLLVQNPEEMRHVLSNLLIVRAENDFITDTITYYAYSELFEPIEDLNEPPRYNLVVTREQDGKISVRAEKVG